MYSPKSLDTLHILTNIFFVHNVSSQFTKLHSDLSSILSTGSIFHSKFHECNIVATFWFIIHSVYDAVYTVFPLIMAPGCQDQFLRGCALFRNMELPIFTSIIMQGNRIHFVLTHNLCHGNPHLVCH